MMYDYKTSKNLGKKSLDMKKKNLSLNVFSNLSKIEKNKQYLNLQTNLNYLSKDVRLLIDYSKKNNSSKKKTTFATKENGYKNLIFRSNFLLRKNKKKKFTSILNIIDNYITSHQNILDNLEKKKNLLKEKKNQELGKFNNRHLVYKKSINKSVDNNINKLPEINLNLLDKSSETSGTNRKDINISDRVQRFPNVTNKQEKNLKLFTEGNQINEKLNKKYFNNLNLPKKKIDISGNLFIQKFPNIINSQSTKNCINRYALTQNTDKIEKIIKEKNDKIKNQINYKIEEQNLIDWVIKSKLKFARWKFGIAEIEKYFVDFNAYGKQEEEELIKRKTFYDNVEELIDEIKQIEEEKDMKKIQDKHNKEEKKNFNTLDKMEHNIEENNDLYMVDNAINKQSEVSSVLKNIKIRKLNEERTRNKINNILIDSDFRRRVINHSTDKLYFNQYKKGNKIANNKNKSNENEEKYYDEIFEKNNKFLIKKKEQQNFD